MGPQLTTANKILIAAGQLDEEQGTFTAEDLIVRAWHEFPESFGLAGYGQKYPDSNRVLAKLMGSVGLCSRGWLEQVSTKTYRMTPSGRKFVVSLKAIAADPNAAPPRLPVRASLAPSERKSEPTNADRAKPKAREEVPARTAAPPVSAPSKSLRGSAPPPPPAKSAAATPSSMARQVPPAASTGSRIAASSGSSASGTLASSRPVAAKPGTSAPAARTSTATGGFDGTAVLQRLMTSLAAQKWTRGSMVTFQDACAFWGIAAGTHPSQLGAKLEEVDTLLNRALLRVQTSKTAIAINDRVEMNLAQVIGLQGLHRTMAQKYKREIDSMRGRLSESG